MPFNSETNLPPWERGEPFPGALRNTDRLNAPINAIKEIQRYIGSNSQNLDTDWVITYQALGKVLNTGSHNSTELYDIQLSRPDPSIKTGEALNKVIKDGLEKNSTIIATNIAETIAHTHSVAVDTLVHIFKTILELKKGAASHYFFVHATVPLGATFAVNCTQTSGSGGNKTTAASYVYTVNDLAGNQLGTSVAVSGPRPVGLTTAGTLGIAYFDNSGTLKLWSAGEVPTTGACT